MNYVRVSLMSVSCLKIKTKHMVRSFTIKAVASFTRFWEWVS